MNTNNELRDAAQAVVDRWDSPKWKDEAHTGEFINRLRAALAAKEQQGHGRLIVASSVTDELNIVVSVLRDGITTVIYSQRHVMNGDSIGTAELTSEVVPVAAKEQREVVPFPPLPLPVTKHAVLGDMWDRLAMHLYAMKYAALCVATPPAAPVADGGNAVDFTKLREIAHAWMVEKGRSLIDDWIETAIAASGVKP